jgi:very-short-patch-repair endonuclease
MGQNPQVSSRRLDRLLRPQTLDVKARHELPVAVTQLAEAQAGVVSREQIDLLGVSDGLRERLLREGWWRSVTRGVYHTARSHPTWNGLAWAGLLIGGDGARLGPQASGFLHNLIDEAPQPVDVLVPAGRSARVGGAWHFSRERAGARSARSVGIPPHLTVEDTVLDLSATTSEAELVALVTKAVQGKRTTSRRLLEAMDARSRYKHRKLLADILGDVAAGVESPLEMKFLRQVERSHGLPRGSRQRSRCGLPYVSDVGYDEYRVLVELDGRTGHEGAARFRDMNRDNQFALIEWLTLRYGWYDVVNRPCLVAFQIADALVVRGWNGMPTRCFRCVNVPDVDLCG